MAGRRCLKDHGTKSFADVLAPAIELAEKGFPVQASVWRTTGRGLVTKVKAGNDGARANLLKDGRAPKFGEIMHFKALAKTFKVIAAKGREGFYTGEVAEDMVAELKALGGLHTMEDFATQMGSCT